MIRLPIKPATLLGLLLCFGVACGDDDVPPIGDTGIPDRPTADSPTVDVPGVDAPVADAPDVDAPLEDCIVDPVTIAMDFIGTPRPVSVEPDPAGFLLAWRQQMGDAEDIYTGVVTATSESATTSQLTDDLGSKRNAVMRDGMALWEDDLALRTEYVVRGRVVGSGDEFSVTSDTGNAQRPSVSSIGDNRWIVGYSEQEGANWVVKVRSYDGSTFGNAETLATLPAPADLALEQAGDNVAAAWQEGGDIRLHMLDTNAAPISSESIVISTENNAVGPVRLAYGELGGAVIFDVSLGGRPEVRSRLLELDGSPKRPEQIVSQAPSQGRVANAVYYNGGFGVIYHQRLDGMTTVQMAFVHGSDGDVVARAELGAAGFDDGLPGIAVAADGLILGAWAEISGLGTDIRAVRVTCPGAWLRCSPMGTE